MASQGWPTDHFAEEVRSSHRGFPGGFHREKSDVHRQSPGPTPGGFPGGTFRVLPILPGCAFVYATRSMKPADVPRKRFDSSARAPAPAARASAIAAVASAPMVSASVLAASPSAFALGAFASVSAASAFAPMATALVANPVATASIAPAIEVITGGFANKLSAKPAATQGDTSWLKSF